MAIDLSTVSVKLQATGIGQVKGAFGEIGKEAAKVKKNIADLLSPTKNVAAAIAGLGAAFTATAATAFLKSAIDEARDAEDKLAQLKVAVDNTGASFSDWKDRTDAAADGLEKVTRYSDEAARGALTTLISISGNVAGAITNLGVTADLAAAKHIDLNAAAELVGKAMIGNTKALKKMGIEAKSGTDIMEVLRQKFQGFAESDAQTLTGSLDQVSNAWKDVKEAIGNAILGMNDVPGKTNAIRDALVDLKTYIEENTEKWRGWAKNMLDPDFGPIRILNKIVDLTTKAGLGLHGIATQDFSALEAYMNGPRDYTSLNQEGDHLGAPRTAGKIDARVTASQSADALKKEEEAAKKASAALDERIKMLGKAVIFDDLRAKVTKELVEIEARLKRELAAGNLTIDRRIDLTEKLTAVEKAHDNAVRINKMMAKPTGPTVSVTPGDPHLGQFPGLDTGPMKNIPDKLKELPPLINESGKKVVDAMNDLQSKTDAAMQSFGQVLGDGIYAAFEAAFNGEGLGGIFKAFGKTVLAGIGNIFTQMGSAYLSYGLIMTGLIPSLANPFTSGPTAIAIGVLLTALGGALGAISHGASRGTAASGAFRESTNGSSIVSLKFIDRNGRPAMAGAPNVTNNFTVIGANDPRAQRDIAQLIANGQRR